MSRVPLFPANSNYRTWALEITKRIERDFVLLSPKTNSISLSDSISNVITDINMLPNSTVFLQPKTSQAAAMSAWVSDKSQGQFVITSAAAASASCVFDYIIFPPPPLET